MTPNLLTEIVNSFDGKSRKTAAKDGQSILREVKRKALSCKHLG